VFKRSFITVILALGLAFSLNLVSQYSQENAIGALQQRTQADLNRYILTMRQKLARFRDIPRLLSTHPDLIRSLRAQANSNDLIRANLHLEQVNNILGTRDTYLMNSSGVTVAASGWQGPKTFIGRNFNFRPYFIKAMDGELGQYFALGTTSKKRGFYYSYPVRHRGTTLGVVVVKIDLNEIEQDWSEQDIELIVSDEDGVIFISTRDDWKFRTLNSLHSEDLERIAASKRYLGHKLVALKITDRQASQQNSQIITLSEPRLGKSQHKYLIQQGVVGSSDLNVSILADLESVQRQVFANLLYVGTVYIALVLLAMVIWARRRIAKQKSLFEQRELQSLENSEARVKAIINNTRAGLITLDTMGCIESMNVTAQEMFMYTQEDLRTKYFYPLLLDVDEHLYLQQMDELRTGNTETLIEGRFMCRNGKKLPIEFVVGKMHQQGALHFLITVQDITERKQYEAQLDQSKRLLESRVEKRTIELTQANERLTQEIEQHSQTQNELVQTAKLAVIGQMSTGINHELNQPLMAIRGYADNGRKYLALSKEARVDENLSEISLLTERMAKILHPLKEFSRKSSGLQQSVSLLALRSGVLAILFPKFEKSVVTVAWEAPMKDVLVCGDLLRLEQVMVNLITNAMHAAEHNLSEQEQPKVVISQLIDELNSVQILVRDNGVGISENNLPKVFEPFFTTKKEGQGLGLGLSISQRIIEDLDGQLTANNYRVNPSDSHISGAQFTVTLQKG
jgi:two-component system C4-dicarboxylate transport sensor histidine kinase DctB